MNYNSRMFDFICILTIILEFFVITICCKKISELEKKVQKLNINMQEKGVILIKNFKETRKTIQKINKVMRILTNKKFWQIKKIIFMIIDTIQLIMLIKSLDFSKGLKSINYKTIKKLLLAQISKEVIRKILTFSPKTT